MTSRKNPFFIIIFLLMSFNYLQAQTDISIGEWKSHLPYQIGKYVTQSNDDIIYATDGGVIYISKQDNSIKTLDKKDGLSGVGIERIKYNQANDILMIAYSNSIIDLVKPREIITLSDIQRFNNISGDKSIYDIFLDSDSTALLATGYGISKINLNQDIFLFSTFTGVPINGVTVHDDLIYATTDEGTYRAPNQSNVNLQDFGIWEYLDSINGFPNDYFSGELISFNNNLYLNVDTALYRYENGTLNHIYSPENNYKINFLSADGEHLVVGLICGDGGCDGSLVFFDTNENFSEIQNDCVDRPSHAVQDEKGDLWIADEWYRFRRYNVTSQLCDPGFVLNSPFVAKNYDLAIKDGELWVTAGGVDIRKYFQFWYEGLFTKIDGEWNYYNRLNRQDLAGTLDFLRIAFHPEKDITYISTYFDGLLKYENDVFEIFDNSNSSLGNNTISDTARTRVAGLAFDDNNNLWIANTAADSAISVFTDDGEMIKFAIASNVNPDPPLGLFEVVIDDFGNKWFTVAENSAGLFVFNETNLEVTGDEQRSFISTANSSLPTNNVNALAKDLDGDIWVGTGDGIIIFECGSNVFDREQCKGTRKIVEQDGIPAYLLVGEDVRAITVDGANRKWVGTNNGVFVLSEDGEELIARFNEDNSPIFDNSITDIEIDPESGEVYIGTEEGIISYRSDATLGGNLHRENALVFPNPVRPEYEGPIAIKGLARDSNVKITDINGQLVYETTALGGQAIWNGRDYTGRKAASGVYLVLGTTTKNFEEPESIVAKILFIN